MKILEVQIENFGKFRNFSYKFNGSGIEILNGENEFGKTTLISFIQRVLYGFPDKRRAENMYDCDGTPYGGRLLCIDNNNRPITIERLGRTKGGVLKIYDSASGEELNSADYIRHSADFYRNIYMIRLKDLLDEATLNTSEIQHHLYGIERSFGNASPKKIQNMLKNKCDELCRPKGNVQIIPQLEKQLRELEKNQKDLNSEIEKLSIGNTDLKYYDEEEKKLAQELALLEKIAALKQRYEELKQKSLSPFKGELPDNTLLARKNEINSLIEKRSSIAETFAEFNSLNQKISQLEKENISPDFQNQTELEQAFLDFVKLQNEYGEKVKKAEFQQEKIKKHRRFSLVSYLLAVLAVAGCFTPAGFFSLVLMLPAIWFIFNAPDRKTAQIPPAPEDKNEYFSLQKKLLEKKKLLDEYLAETNLLKEKITAFTAEVKLFQQYLPEKFSADLDREIKLLRQQLNENIRKDAQFEMHKKTAEFAAKEAESVKNIINSVDPDGSTDTNKIVLLKQERENIIAKRSEAALKINLINSKINSLRSVENSYLMLKNEFNKHCRSYLKWKTALNLWEKTIQTFEKERQGDVMQSASKYFAAVTNNAYCSVRKSLNSEELLVFDGKNDKTVDILSSGTREQLLLVIRLALIGYIEKNSPSKINMPLLMDDIFVNYDCGREKAAWQLLKDFSADRQIIFCRAKTADLADA